jgi:hypothetical protein
VTTLPRSGLARGQVRAARRSTATGSQVHRQMSDETREKNRGAGATTRRRAVTPEHEDWRAPYMLPRWIVLASR